MECKHSHISPPYPAPWRLYSVQFAVPWATRRAHHTRSSQIRLPLVGPQTRLLLAGAHTSVRKTHSPPSMVAVGLTRSSSLGEIINGSRSSTTRSASLPGVIEP